MLRDYISYKFFVIRNRDKFSLLKAFVQSCMADSTATSHFCRCKNADVLHG